MASLSRRYASRGSDARSGSGLFMQWHTQVFSFSLLLVPILATGTGEPQLARSLCRSSLEEAALRVLDPQSEHQLIVDEELLRRGIDPKSVQKLNQAFRIFPDFPQFGLRFGVSHHRFRLATLEEQIDEVGRFLREYYIDMCGQPTGMFSIREVALTPKSTSCTSFTGQRLLFAIPSGFVGGYKLVKASELRKAWDAGLMLPQKSVFREMWAFLNPVGPFRMGMREHLKQVSAVAVQAVTRLISASKLQPFAQRIAQIKRFADVSRLNADELGRLGSLSEENGEKLLNRWKELLVDSQLRESLSETAVQTALAAKSRPRNYDVSLYGLIVVGNVHHVVTNVTVGPARFLARVGDEEAPFVKARAAGLIVVYTIDNVETDLHVRALMDRAVETAALSQALSEVGEE